MAERKEFQALPDSTAQELKQIEANLDQLSPDEKKDFEAYKGWLATQYEMPGISTSDVLEGIGKGLDYAGGVVRSVPAMALGAMTPQEAAQALMMKKNFPNSSEIMRRLGVPQGATLSDYASALYEDPQNPNSDRWYVPNKGGVLDPSVRGTVGLGLDIATDPLTYLSMGGTVAGKTAVAKSTRQAARGLLGNPVANAGRDMLQAAREAIVNSRGAGAVNAVGAPLRNTAEYVGNVLSRHGVRPLDKEAVKMGDRPISDLLTQKGIYGSSEGIEEAMLRESDQLRDAAEKLAQRADSIDPVKTGMYGARTGGVDMRKAMQPAQGAVGALEDVVPHGQVQEAMQQSIDDLFNLGNTSYQKAIQNKKALYDVIPDSAYATNAYTAPGGRVRRAQAAGIREAVEQGAERAEKGLGQQIANVNDEWGRYLTVKDAASQMAGRAKRGISPGQASAAMGMVPSPWAIGQTAVDATRATPLSTTAGYFLQKGANAPLVSTLPDAYIRQKVLEALRMTPEEK